MSLSFFFFSWLRRPLRYVPTNPVMKKWSSLLSARRRWRVWLSPTDGARSFLSQASFHSRMLFDSCFPRIDREHLGGIVMYHDSAPRLVATSPQWSFEVAFAITSFRMLGSSYHGFDRLVCFLCYLLCPPSSRLTGLIDHTLKPSREISSTLLTSPTYNNIIHVHLHRDSSSSNSMATSSD